MTNKPKILVVYGTRPEAIKVAPLILALQSDDRFELTTVVSGQHREMLDQVNEVFGILPDLDLDTFTPQQPLNAIVGKVLERLDPVLERLQPDAMVVQGDTSTVAAAAIAGFNRGVKIVHVEAGLRSGDLWNPFPEEANRRITSQVTSLHLAPTEQSRQNLLRENVSPADVVVTGNTVIDALLTAVGEQAPLANPNLAAVAAAGRPLILVTAHRRENLGGGMDSIGDALARIAAAFPDHTVALPIHRNPRVRESILPRLAPYSNVVISEPLGYGEFTHLLSLARIVITDSGGVQEEAPSLGIPVLVMRENTERPEAVEAGTVKLVGTDPDRIFSEASHLLTSSAAHFAMAKAVNPYGDGRAVARCVGALAAMFGVGEREPDFRPF